LELVWGAVGGEIRGASAVSGQSSSPAPAGPLSSLAAGLLPGEAEPKREKSAVFPTKVPISASGGGKPPFRFV